MIDVQKIDDTTYAVTVTAGKTTHHRVTVSQGYYDQLTAGSVSPERLLEKSFAFLLEREPNTAILASFDLTAIRQYFPEYEHDIRHLLD